MNTLLNIYFPYDPKHNTNKLTFTIYSIAKSRKCEINFSNWELWFVILILFIYIMQLKKCRVLNGWRVNDCVQLLCPWRFFNHPKNPITLIYIYTHYAYKHKFSYTITSIYTGDERCVTTSLLAWGQLSKHGCL